MADAVVQPAGSLRGSVLLPGDKSISHRALMLGALAEGKIRICGISTARDVLSTASCLEALGVTIEKKSDEWVVHGVGLGGLRKSRVILNAGNSGTTMRLLSGLLAGHSFSSVLDGDASLRRRPMERVLEPLRLMGAKIGASEGGTAPFRVAGGGLRGITYTPTVASSQVKSAVLLAGLLAEGETTVIEVVPTRDHTEIMLEAMGVSLQCGEGSLSLRAHPLTAAIIEVPGDLSSAAFFVAAALMVPESEIRILGVGINPTRNYFLRVLEQAGGGIRREHERKTEGGEWLADLVVRSSVLRAFELTGHQIPLVIDEIPILAVMATQAQGRSKIRDAQELRVKESDRIEAIASNLQRMGAVIEVFPDGLEIEGPVRLRGAAIEAFGDHRIAMALTIAGLVAEGPTVIQGAEVVAVSFPDFFDGLGRIQRPE